MRETLQLLRGLQELDEDLYRINDELRRLPKERERRRERIENERSHLAEFDRKLADTRTRIKEIEDMTTSQRQRLRKLENEVNNTADQALIASYQHEMRTLKRYINEAEEEGLGLVDTNETIASEANALRAAIEGLEKEFEEYSRNVEAEMAQAEEKRAGLVSERQKRLSGSVSQAVLEQYEKLLEAREGQAMAMLESKVCQGCYVSVPNNIYVKLARATELVLCPSCGRILYLPDAL